MYLLTEFILFIPLIVYACIQVQKLIPGSKLRHIFLCIIVFLFIGYPAAEGAAHSQVGTWAQALIFAGYFCLPLLLYIVLTVVAVDLLILIGRWTRLIRPEVLSLSRFRYFRLACYLIIPAFIVAFGAWNNNRLHVKHISIELPRKSSKLETLNVVFASDFHLSQITGKHLVERFVDEINALSPDIVLIGGDIVEGHGNEDLDRFEAEFRKIRSRYGVFAAQGNHESHRGGSNRFFEKAGMRLLEDAAEKIDNSFYLVVRRNWRFSRKPISDLLKEVPEDLPVILLDHVPRDLENVSNTRVDVQFSGHTHNGQLFPINLVIMPFEYEIAWGTKIKRNTVFIVSSGLQAWGPPVKTAGDSEIISAKIHFFGGKIQPRID